MPDISTVTMPSGIVYDIKDAAARQYIVGGVRYIGITTSAIQDGSTLNPIVIRNEWYTAVNGDLTVYENGEFIYDGAEEVWREFGDLSALGDLAYKDSVVTPVTPEGTVSQPTFTGSQMTSTGRYTPVGSVSVPTFTGIQGNISVSGTPAGTVSQPTFTGSELTSTGKFTPAGSVSTPEFTGTEGNVSVSGTPVGSIGVGSGAANYTPTGSVSAPTLTVTPFTTTKYVADSATGGGSVTPGVAAQASMPQLATSIDNDTLIISWTPGSFTANQPTAVTLPTFSGQTIATGIESASATAPAFTGNGVNLTFTGEQMSASGKFTPSGNVSKPSFTGTEGNVNVSGTPAGTVSQPTFSGSALTSTGTFTPDGSISRPEFAGIEGNISVSGTPAGTVSQPTFSGTQRDYMGT